MYTSKTKTMLFYQYSNSINSVQMKVQVMVWVLNIGFLGTQKHGCKPISPYKYALMKIMKILKTVPIIVVNVIIPNNTDVPIESAKWVALCWSVITLYVKLASGSLPFWLFDMEKSSKSSKLLVLLPYSQDILFMDLVVLYVVIVYELSKKIIYSLAQCFKKVLKRFIWVTVLPKLVHFFSDLRALCTQDYECCGSLFEYYNRTKSALRKWDFAFGLLKTSPPPTASYSLFS